MFKVTLTADEGDMRELRKLAHKVKDGLINGMEEAVLFVESKTKKRMGKSGEVGVVTGHLRRSIKSGVKTGTKQFGSKVIGWVGSNVKYAPVHEYGATIRPVRGKWLRFKIMGQWKTVRQVIIPARPFLRPSIEENIKQIGDIIRNSIVERTSK